MIAAATPPVGVPQPLPLFPLQAVLFPQGLLQLRIFEARYLDLMSNCMRQGTGFGVVTLAAGSEVQQGGAHPSATRFEAIGTLAQLLEVDAEQPGILRVRCVGSVRVHTESPLQQDDGLWLATARVLPPDPVAVVPDDLAGSSQALSRAIESMAAQGQSPFLEPYHLTDAGWVANRWCEILPIPLSAKHRLMTLDEPITRLRLVDDYLRGKGII